MKIQWPPVIFYLRTSSTSRRTAELAPAAAHHPILWPWLCWHKSLATKICSCVGINHKSQSTNHKSHGTNHGGAGAGTGGSRCGGGAGKGGSGCGGRAGMGGCSSGTNRTGAWELGKNRTASKLSVRLLQNTQLWYNISVLLFFFLSLVKLFRAAFGRTNEINKLKRDV